VESPSTSRYEVKRKCWQLLLSEELHDKRIHFCDAKGHFWRF
jgi:hypothetical protein